MIDLQVVQRSALQKIPVECRTCGVSEAFYSNLSVDKFKARHSGHDVVSRNTRAEKATHTDETVSPSEELSPPPPSTEALPPAEEKEPLMRETGIKVAKVLVDVLNFPSLGGPMVRVRGFDSALEEAFTATVLLEEAATIREMFEKGRYLDQNASDLLYQWEPDVVEYVDDAKAKLDALGDAPTKEATAESSPALGESEVIDETAVAATAAVVVETVLEQETKQAEVVSAPEQPELSSPSPMVEGSPMVPAPDSPPQTAQATAPELEPTEPSAPAISVLPQSAPSVRVKAAPMVVTSRSQETAADGHLLVSKSWYIQGGTGNRDEAIRISQVLKAFRWNVEPLYTIGVMLDDMLSIETSRPQISGRLIKRIEASGYRLTAVVNDKGKPVAWFKREGSDEDLLFEATGDGPDDSEMELEPDVTG